MKLLIKGPLNSRANLHEDKGHVIKNIENIHGVIGFWDRGGILTTPLLGYDLTLPQKVGIYRLLSLEIMKTGRKKNLLVNASGGVGDFKRKRGALSFVEFNGVYCSKNISMLQKLPWMTLNMLTNLGMSYISRRKDI